MSLKIIKTTTILLLCLISYQSSAHELDSLLKRLPKTTNETAKIELWEKIINISIFQTSDEQRKGYIDDLWKYSKSKNNEYGIATANLSYSKHFERQQDLESARKHAKEAYNSFEKQKNKLGLCKVLRQQGFNALKISDVELATELAYKALDISIEIKDKLQEALCIGQIAILSYETQREEAIKLQKQSLEILMRIGAHREATVAIINLSTFYQNMYNDGESLKYLDTLFLLQEKLNDVVTLAAGNLSAAISYNSLGMLQKADEAMEKSEYYYMSMDNPSKQAEFYRIKGVFYRNRGEYAIAIEVSKKGLSLIESKEGLEMEKGWLNYNLYDSYKSLKKYKEALEAYEKTTDYKSILYDDKTQQIITELKERYETQKKEEEILLLQEQNKVKDARLEKRTYFIAILSLIVILLLAGVFFIRRHIKLKQQKVAAELEHKALRAQMNPHFIFNALNSIQRIYVERNLEKANDYMADFAQLMRKILENSGLAKITLAEEIDTLRLYMDLEMLRCKNCFKYIIHIDESLSTGLKIAPLLLQPFVENSIWHGVLPLNNKAGEIDIHLTDFDKEYIQVTIKDNGVGFDLENPTENKNSKGISITKQRIDGDLIITSEQNKGTTITFKLKKQHD